MVGRLRSLPLTFLGAVILGELEYLLAFIDTNGSAATPFADLAKDLQASAPVIMLFVVLIFLPEDRGRPRGRRAGTARPSRRMRTMVAVDGRLRGGRLRDRAVRVGLGVAPSTSSARASRSASSCCRSCCSPGTAGQMSLAQLALRRHRRATVWKLGPVVGLVGGVRDRGRRRRARRAAGAADARASTWPSPRWRSPCSSSMIVYGDNPLFQQMLPFVARQRHRRPASRVRERHGLLRAPWPSCSRSWSCVLTVIRNGPFGRRLQAMKDSPGGLRHPRPRPHRHEAPGRSPCRRPSPGSAVRCWPCGSPRASA